MAACRGRLGVCHDRSAIFKPMMEPASLAASSASSTKGSPARPMNGEHCARGPGLLVVVSIISRPIPLSTPNTLASKASPATAKLPSSRWPTIRASPWCSLALPVKEEPPPAPQLRRSRREPYWHRRVSLDGRQLLKYGASKATTGSMNPSDIPVDSNELLALCAPRLTFVSYGIPEKGDAQWLDQRGSWMATVAASPVWTLLGAHGSAPTMSTTAPPTCPRERGSIGWQARMAPGRRRPHRRTQHEIFHPLGQQIHRPFAYCAIKKMLILNKGYVCE